MALTRHDHETLQVQQEQAIALEEIAKQLRLILIVLAGDRIIETTDYGTKRVVLDE